jgi:hypothetical protein
VRGGREQGKDTDGELISIPDVAEILSAEAVVDLEGARAPTAGSSSRRLPWL